MKKVLFALALAVLAGANCQAQIRIDEEKAVEVIDVLFGRKKKKNQNSNATVPNYGDYGQSSGSESQSEPLEDEDDYTPEEVDFGSLDMTRAISFRVLINMLPERTQGFSRNRKPEGARYSTQGISYSTGMKEYKNGNREMTISLNDYLGAEYIASAQTAQQFEYESTDGYAKSVEVDGIPGWVSIDYENNEGTLFLYLQERFYATVTTTDTSESELVAIAGDIKLARLKRELD